MNCNWCSLRSLEQAVNYLLGNCFFKVGSQIFLQVIGIPVGSDPASFFANLFLFHYKSEWIGNMKTIDHHHARMFGNIYTFIDDLIAMNDSKEFENSFKEIYSAELELKKENTNDNTATFLDLNITIKDGQLSTKLYDKGNGFNFSIVRLP